jgi:hypothetical protein
MTSSRLKLTCSLVRKSFIFHFPARVFLIADDRNEWDVPVCCICNLRGYLYIANRVDIYTQAYGPQFLS